MFVAADAPTSPAPAGQYVCSSRCAHVTCPGGAVCFDRGVRFSNAERSLRHNHASGPSRSKGMCLTLDTNNRRPFSAWFDFCGDCKHTAPLEPVSGPAYAANIRLLWSRIARPTSCVVCAPWGQAELRQNHVGGVVLVDRTKTYADKKQVCEWNYRYFPSYIVWE